jgi:hypothetical protein
MLQGFLCFQGNVMSVGQMLTKIRPILVVRVNDPLHSIEMNINVSEIC